MLIQVNVAPFIRRSEKGPNGGYLQRALPAHIKSSYAFDINLPPPAGTGSMTDVANELKNLTGLPTEMFYIMCRGYPLYDGTHPDGQRSLHGVILEEGNIRLTFALLLIERQAGADKS